MLRTSAENETFRGHLKIVQLASLLSFDSQLGLILSPMITFYLKIIY